MSFSANILPLIDILLSCPTNQIKAAGAEPPPTLPHQHHPSTPPPHREYPLHMQNNRVRTAPTVERDTSQRPVLPLPVLRHALERPGVLLLEVWNLKDGIEVLRFHLAGKRDAAGSPPAYFWHWAEGK